MLQKIKLSAKDWVINHKKRISNRESFGKLKMCKKCYTFYYKNSWHFDRPQYLGVDQDKDIVVRFTECPACMEQELALYEMESEQFLRRV